MKKLLSFMLIAAMLLSLAACSSSIKETKTFASFDLLEGDTYSFEMEFAEVDDSLITICRKGNSFKASALGTETFIVDMREFVFDHKEKIAYYVEITEQEFKKTLGDYARPDKAMVDLNGAKKEKTGNDYFMGEDRYYEEIKTKRETARVFFDGDTIVGLLMEKTDGTWGEVKFYISPDVPEDAFKIPEDYKVMPLPDLPPQ